MFPLPCLPLKPPGRPCGPRNVCLFVGCLTSQQQASVSQERICSDTFTCCHTEIEVADQTFYLTQSQYTDTGPTSPSADPITPGAWQGSHSILKSLYDPTPKKSRRKRDSNPGSSALEANAFPLGQQVGARKTDTLTITSRVHGEDSVGMSTALCSTLTMLQIDLSLAVAAPAPAAVMYDRVRPAFNTLHRWWESRCPRPPRWPSG